jgi:hypothetical protein
MENKAKKPYIKPEVTQVQMVAEEAVLAVCKDGAASGACIPDPVCSFTPRS